MPPPLAFLVLPLWLAAGAAPAEGCPADEAVTAHIGRLGAAQARAQAGTIDVAVDEGGMRIVLRARDGTILGMREVAAPDACEERAVVAAVVITTWLGEWAAARAAPPGVPPPRSPEVSARAVSALPASPARRAELAAFVFGAHDADASTWGVGAQGSYGLGAIAALTALGEVTGERQRTLGPGQAAYRLARVGVGVAARRALGRDVLLDGALVPELFHLSLRGVRLLDARPAAAWGLAVDARVRLGVRLGAIVPFLYADGSYALTATRLTLDNSRSDATLSRWGVAAGLGILLPFGPLGG